VADLPHQPKRDRGWAKQQAPGLQAVSAEVQGDDAASVTASTVCTVHNLAGKVYLFFIAPFHRFGVKKLTSNAVAARRL
jgi:hypothetical protein